MLDFITNLLPRLRQLSQSLDHTEAFVDKPWVLLDEDSQQQTYIFQRGGKLIMSLDGKVQMGTWEYIAAAQSLLIDRGADQLLLNHFFFTDALLVLARDGRPESKFVLANRQLIPDLDIGNYLRVLEAKQAIQLKSPTGIVAAHQLRQAHIKTDGGGFLEFFTIGTFVAIGDAVYQDGNQAQDSRYVTERGWGIDVKDGVIKHLFWPKKYQLRTGETIIIDRDGKQSHATYNNRVFWNNALPVEDGKYSIVDVGKVRILNGKIEGFPLF